MEGSDSFKKDTEYDSEIDNMIEQCEEEAYQQDQKNINREIDQPCVISTKLALNYFSDWQKKETIYKGKNQKYKDDIYQLNGTTKLIHFKEIDFLRLQLKEFTWRFPKKMHRVLNIPSGSGRLNNLLLRYFEEIHCMDACQESLQKIKKNAKISVENIFIQEFCYEDNQIFHKNKESQQNDAIFCNYGISYLDILQLRQFLTNIYNSDILKPNGLLIIKECFVGSIHTTPVILQKSKRIILQELNYREITREFRKKFDIERESCFIHSFEQYPEKFIILRKKEEEQNEEKIQN